MANWIFYDKNHRIVGDQICKDKEFDSKSGDDWCEDRVLLHEGEDAYQEAVD